MAMANSTKRPKTGEGTSSNRTPLSPLAHRFVEHLNALETLCRDLETIADALPASVNVQAGLRVAQNISPIINSAHQFEEQHIYPIIVLAVSNGAGLSADIERLKSEHWVDEDFGEEVGLALNDFIAQQNATKAEILSWMLRGFFESMRRHIAFESAVILPLVEKKLESKNA